MPRTRNSFKRSADLSQEASYNAEMAEYHAQQAMYAAQEAEYYAQEVPAASYAGNRDCDGYDSRWQQARCFVRNLPEKKREPTAAQYARYAGNAVLWNRDCDYDSKWQQFRCYTHTLPEKKNEPTAAQLAQYWGNVRNMYSRN